MVSCAFQNGFFPDAQLPVCRQPVYAHRNKASRNRFFLSVIPTGGYRMTTVGLQGGFTWTPIIQPWAGHRNGGPCAHTVIEYRVPLVTAVT